MPVGLLALNPYSLNNYVKYKQKMEILQVIYSELFSIIRDYDSNALYSDIVYRITGKRPAIHIALNKTALYLDGFITSKYSAVYIKTLII